MSTPSSHSESSLQNHKDVWAVFHISDAAGRNLPSADLNGSIDAYLTFKFAGVSKKTDTVKSCFNPDFQTDFTFHSTFTNSPNLEVQMWDWDRGSADDSIGSKLVLSLNDIRTSKTGLFQQYFEPRNGSPSYFQFRCVVQIIESWRLSAAIVEHSINGSYATPSSIQFGLVLPPGQIASLEKIPKKKTSSSVPNTKIFLSPSQMESSFKSFSKKRTIWDNTVPSSDQKFRWTTGYANSTQNAMIRCTREESIYQLQVVCRITLNNDIFWGYFPAIWILSDQSRNRNMFVPLISQADGSQCGYMTFTGYLIGYSSFNQRGLYENPCITYWTKTHTLDFRGFSLLSATIDSPNTFVDNFSTWYLGDSNISNSAVENHAVAVEQLLDQYSKTISKSNLDVLHAIVTNILLSLDNQQGLAILKKRSSIFSKLQTSHLLKFSRFSTTEQRNKLLDLCAFSVLDPNHCSIPEKQVSGDLTQLFTADPKVLPHAIPFLIGLADRAIRFSDGFFNFLLQATQLAAKSNDINTQTGVFAFLSLLLKNHPTLNVPTKFQQGFVELATQLLTSHHTSSSTPLSRYHLTQILSLFSVFGQHCSNTFWQAMPQILSNLAGLNSPDTIMALAEQKRQLLMAPWHFGLPTIFNDPCLMFSLVSAVYTNAQGGEEPIKASLASPQGSPCLIDYLTAMVTNFTSRMNNIPTSAVRAIVRIFYDVSDADLLSQLIKKLITATPKFWSIFSSFTQYFQQMCALVAKVSPSLLAIIPQNLVSSDVSLVFMLGLSSKNPFHGIFQSRRFIAIKSFYIGIEKNIPASRNNVESNIDSLFSTKFSLPAAKLSDLSSTSVPPNSVPFVQFAGSVEQLRLSVDCPDTTAEVFSLFWSSWTGEMTNWLDNKPKNLYQFSSFSQIELVCWLIDLNPANTEPLLDVPLSISNKSHPISGTFLQVLGGILSRSEFFHNYILPSQLLEFLKKIFAATLISATKRPSLIKEISTPVDKKIDDSLLEILPKLTPQSSDASAIRSKIKAQQKAQLSYLDNQFISPTPLAVLFQGSSKVRDQFSLQLITKCLSIGDPSLIQACINLRYIPSLLDTLGTNSDPKILDTTVDLLLLTLELSKKNALGFPQILSSNSRTAPSTDIGYIFGGSLLPRNLSLYQNGIIYINLSKAERIVKTPIFTQKVVKVLSFLVSN